MAKLKIKSPLAAARFVSGLLPSGEVGRGFLWN